MPLYRKEAKRVQDEADAAERREANARHQIEDAAWQAFLDNAAGPRVAFTFERFHQIEKLGGFTAARALYTAATR